MKPHLRMTSRSGPANPSANQVQREIVRDKSSIEDANHPHCNFAVMAPLHVNYELRIEKNQIDGVDPPIPRFCFPIPAEQRDYLCSDECSNKLCGKYRDRCEPECFAADTAIKTAKKINPSHRRAAPAREPGPWR